MENSVPRAVYGKFPLCQGLAVTGVDFFGKLETTEPATTSRKAKDSSSGGVKPESPIYAPPVRQRPGGNSSLVLG